MESSISSRINIFDLIPLATCADCVIAEFQ